MGGGTFIEMVRSEVRVERGMKRFRDPSTEEVALAYAVLEVSAMYCFFTTERD